MVRAMCERRSPTFPSELLAQSGKHCGGPDLPCEEVDSPCPKSDCLLGGPTRRKDTAKRLHHADVQKPQSQKDDIPGGSVARDAAQKRRMSQADCKF